jgi:ATP-binding cassette subfamily C protein LapB
MSDHGQSLTPIQGRAFDWFWSALWRFKSFYVESFLATIVANVLTLASVFFSMNVYDRVVPTQAYVTLWTLAIGTALAIALEFVMRLLKSRLIDIGGKRADLAINAALLKEVMAIRLESRPQSAGIFASAMREFDALRDFFSSASMVALADVPFGLLFLVLIGLVGGPLVWAPLLAIPVVVGVGCVVQRQWMEATRQGMKEAGDKQSVLIETIAHLEIIKAHQAQAYLQERWEKSNHAAAQAYQRVRSSSNLLLGVTSSLQQWVTVCMIVAGVYMIHANQLSLGGLIACVILAGRAMSPMGSIATLISRYQQAHSALQTLDALMQRPKDTQGASMGLVPQTLQGELKAHELSFTYPQTNDQAVIRGLTLHIAAGQRMALLGRVGAGKSTLLRLLAGLYTPTAGSVRLDGLEMQQIQPQWVREHMGYVGQEPHVFLGSLRDNLVLADAAICDDQIVQVLSQVGLYEWVAQHPLGLNMPITDLGGGMSGGQRQQVCLARMMLRDPKLVFMDEPTAHMDAQTESLVIRALSTWLAGRTVVMSTHRTQLLVLAQHVALLDAGKCVAVGPKDEVLNQLS